MPLFDKVKAQAAQVAQRAQEAGKAGQAKLEDVQARRKYDALLRDLGSNVFAERSGKGDGNTSAEIDRIVSELEALGEQPDAETTESSESAGAPTPNSGGMPEGKVFGDS
jgi:hypothetical protein